MLAELSQATLQKNFWNDSYKAKSVLRDINYIEKEINGIKKINKYAKDLSIHNELLSMGEPIGDEFIESINKCERLLDSFEINNLLNAEHDQKGAILSIHPGAGGTESQDWAHMLYRMYIRWCEKNEYSYNVLNFQDGDEAGIKDVTIEIDNNFSFGMLKSEIGVHRLVRISPFDANSRRHTSFAAVFVTPIPDNEVKIVINDKDIRIDTYRASGAGGQHVNKTDSAVRITHIPSGVVVQCQNQRSQLKNKNSAMKILNSKLYQLQIEETNKDMNKFSTDKKSIEWGSQIRSYIFQPYNMVKDHRTKEETSNISEVMDGKIDKFIRSYLLNKSKNVNER